MPVRVAVEFPQDNRVVLSERFLSESSGSIEIRGRGNDLRIEDPFAPNSAHVVLADGARVVIEANANLNDLFVAALAAGAVVEIGAWASFNGQCEITAHEPSTIRIGPRCLFGSRCRIASSDVHKVLDLATGERINPAGDIEIGEHVWAAADVTILRNTSLGRDSVVGSRSLVRGAFPANVTLAGLPVRVVRTGVTWEF